jgi:uncharacterized UBP type Zn finger protein
MAPSETHQWQMQQQDAHEFQRYLLAELENESRRGSGTRPLRNIFASELMTTVACSICRDQSTNHQSYTEITLQINNSETNTLVEALDLFFASETIEDRYCVKCNEKPMAEKKSSVLKFPRVLQIQFNRFIDQNTKLIKAIVVPTMLDLGKYLTSGANLDGNFMYQLKSTVNHIGNESLSRGHYTAIGLAIDGSYSVFDDEKQALTATGQQLNQAYLVSYERVEEVSAVPVAASKTRKRVKLFDPSQSSEPEMRSKRAKPT